jgi:hypothetical protein
MRVGALGRGRWAGLALVLCGSHARAQVPVDLEAQPPGSLVHWRDDAAVDAGDCYPHACRAPCRATLAPGLRTFALSRPAGAAIEAEPFAVPVGPARLRLELRDRRVMRGIGWFVLSTGVTAGLVLVTLAVATAGTDCHGDVCGSAPSERLLLLSGASLSVGLGLGISLVVQHDRVDITLVPGPK